MSFANEVKDSTKAIKEFAHMQLRSQFPYMRIEVLEELLTKTTKDLTPGLEEKEQDMRAVQSRTSFLSLSAELRNAIYEMALKIEDSIDASRKIDILQHTGLLFVSRQIHDEALSIWYAVNTFKFDIGDPYYRAHPEEAEPGRFEVFSPEIVSNWLTKIGRGAKWIKSISLELTSPDPASRVLWEILNFNSRRLDFNGLTVHQAVLKSVGLVNAGLAPETFTLLYREDYLSSRKQVSKDLYEAAGVKGDDNFTDKLVE